MNRNLSTIFFSWVSSHLVCKNIQLIQLWGVGNVGSHLAERSRVWSQPPLVYLPVQDNYRLNELKCSYRCTSVLSYNIQHVKKSSVCVCMHQCVCVCLAEGRVCSLLPLFWKVSDSIQQHRVSHSTWHLEERKGASERDRETGGSEGGWGGQLMKGLLCDVSLEKWAGLYHSSWLKHGVHL